MTNRKGKTTWGGPRIDLTKPFKRLSIWNAGGLTVEHREYKEGSNKFEVVISTNDRGAVVDRQITVNQF